MKKIKAFTLAEVLITLAIIGVVAALTIPTVVSNYQRRMYVTQLKKNYSNITNGFKAYMAKEGVTRLTDTTLWATIPNNEIFIEDLFNEESEGFRNELLTILKRQEYIALMIFPRLKG